MLYTLEAVAAEVNVAPRTIRYWIFREVLPRPPRGRGPHCSGDFIRRAWLVRRWLDRYPRADLGILRDQLQRGEVAA